MTETATSTRLARLGPAGREQPVALTDDGRYLDVRPVTRDFDSGFFAGGGIEQVRAAVAAGTLDEVPDAAGLRVGAPIARPGAVVCVGMNYAAHAAESGAAAPSEVVMFYKAPNTVVGPCDDVLMPPTAAKVDWEVELGVVIGRTARYLSSADDALSHVAGYCVSNDVSEREFQLESSGGQWSKGKSCETFNPLGPWLVPAADVPDPQTLQLRCWVNGAARQDSTTADMVFGVADLIYQLSQVTVLEPGDLVNTGTPQGVALGGRFPYLAEGDVVELEVSGLGRQRQTLRRATG